MSTAQLTAVSTTPLISFEENSILVKLSIQRGNAGDMWLNASFVPVFSTDYLYSKDLPLTGVEGMGRPTRLEVHGDLVLKGSVSASADPFEQQFDGVGVVFSVYPAGAVTLRQPIEIPADPVVAFEIAVTYMACSNRGVCRPPVINKSLRVQYDAINHRVKSIAGNVRLKFDTQRDPATDLSATIAEAQRLQRRIIIDVGGDWCIWCHKLDQFFEENPDLYDFMNKNYLIVKVNYSSENDNKNFLAQYPKVAGYPHMFVLDCNGKLLHSQNTGDLEEGDHHDRGKIERFLKTWTLSA
jgi:thioredoxin-related protein